MKNSISIFAIVTLAGSISGFGQMYRPAPLPISKSVLIAQLKQLRAVEPKVTDKLIETANAILDKNGLDFALSLDATTCETIRKAKEQRKDPSAPLNLSATLRSVEAEGASFFLPDPVFPQAACSCYIEVPLLQVTDKDFIAVISGRNIRFHLPTNLATHEAHLLDPKDKTTPKRKWRIPFRGTPIGVSHDENVLYLAFDEPELADLSLLVFGEGVFQIGTRIEAEEGGKGKSIETGKSSERQIKFDRWGKSYIVSYSPRCG
jgi:hypothetical protein